MTAHHTHDTDRRRRLVQRHRLTASARTDDVDAIVSGLVCLHSSDPATVFLSAMSRMAHPEVAPIEEALYERRSLIRHHAMRRTIFVLPRTTARHAHWSTTAEIAHQERVRLAGYLEEAGVTPDGLAWIGDAEPRVLDAVAELGPVTTREIGRAVPELAVPIEPRGGRFSAHSRLLLVLGFRGSVVRTRPRGSWASSQYLWSTMSSAYPGLIDPDAPGDPAESAAAVVRAYLRAFGPATTTDVAWWTGWGLTRTRQALEDAGAIEVSLDSGAGWIDAEDHDGDEVAVDDAEVVFLPGLDPTVMGWKERSFYLTDEHTPRLFDRNGNAGPTIWRGGRVVGGWAQRADGSIHTEILVDDVDVDRVGREAERVARMYGGVRHRVRFPAPLQKDVYRAADRPRGSGDGP